MEHCGFEKRKATGQSSFLQTKVFEIGYETWNDMHAACMVKNILTECAMQILQLPCAWVNNQLYDWSATISLHVKIQSIRANRFSGHMYEAVGGRCAVLLMLNPSC